MLAIADADAKPQLSNSKIYATGIIIRDGSNTEMRRVPSFEQLLLDRTNNNKEITLPERYTFIPVQALAYHELISQQRFSATTFTPGVGPMQGPPGMPGTPGILGVQGLPGATGATGATRCDGSIEWWNGWWWRQHLERTC